MQVTEIDVKQMLAMQTLLKGAELKILATDSIAIAGTVQWFRDFCSRAGKSYQEAKAPKTDAPATVEPVAPPLLPKKTRNSIKKME